MILVKEAIDSTYNEPLFGDTKTNNRCQKRVRAVIQNLNQKFTDNISHFGHFRCILESKDPSSVSKRQMVFKREEYIQHIRDLLEKTRGRELPSTFSPLIKDITHSHITAAWTAAREFLQSAVLHIADKATAKALLKIVILPALENLRYELEKGTEDLLIPHQRGHPITYNDYFTETLQKTRADRQKESFRKALQSYFKVDTLSTSEPIPATIDLQELLNSLVQTTIPDITHFASEEALDCMLAYYKVALKRFVDNIATKVIEVKLLDSITAIFIPITVFEISKDLIRQIAGESGESQSRREQLNKKLKGTDTYKRFVGIRGLSKKSHPISIRILTEFIESSNKLQASSQNNRAIVNTIDSEPVDR
ncbi:Male sterility NAD-binding [Penicillium freii]|nr:Male sterility NAD-binding [Penicillium freii]